MSDRSAFVHALPLAVLLLGSSQATAGVTPTTVNGAAAALLRSPTFQPTVAGINLRTAFVSAESGVTASFTGTDSTMTISRGSRRAAVAMHLVGGSLAAKIQGLEELPWRSNYFAGPAETWRTGVPNYRRVRCSGVYPGIDLEYHWEGGQLEYDWIIHPGSDPARIRVAFGGVSGLSLSANRSLRLRTALGSLEHQSPRAYQIVEGQRHEVSAQFLISRHGVSFRLGSYDRSLPLVIDPTIVFAALLGASTPPSSQSPTLSAISAVAVDPGGNIYAFAGSAGSDFPKPVRSHRTLHQPALEIRMS